jgi:hypothetical protein
MSRVKDLTGKKFGRLLAIKDVGRTRKSGVVWECLCDCGNTARVESYSLSSGNTKSCGCVGKENLIKRSTRHSMRNTKEYMVWAGMKKRVLNSNDKRHLKYAVLGMEEEWKDDFMSFYNHIGPCPVDGKRWSIDRIDNLKGYFIGNVRWATNRQQCRNKGVKSTNTSGFTGVQWRNSVCKTYIHYLASWVGDDYKNKTKTFSSKKYGLIPAFAMACAHREKMIEYLNANGEGYGANHGK